MQDMQKQQFFEDIEKTGEHLKQEFRKLSEQGQKRIDSQIQSAKFEGVYALTVVKSKRTKTMSELNEIRNDLWKQALEKASGDSKKAFIFYDELCDFP